MPAQDEHHVSRSQPEESDNAFVLARPLNIVKRTLLAAESHIKKALKWYPECAALLWSGP